MSRDGSRMWVVFAGALMVVAGSVCFAVEAYQRAKQLRTYANMQAICGRIRELELERGDTLDDSTISDALKSEAEGLDQWDHPFVYYRKRTEAGKISDLLVSYGSDGRLDIKNIEGYYSAAPESVDNHPKRDIVFRDGEPLLSAGK